ncbi:MAG TPA: hypothetical protein VE981_21725 [Planctomycetota bacterium]|nr:hypothetical protein [Planctomycetota bacterium]
MIASLAVGLTGEAQDKKPETPPAPVPAAPGVQQDKIDIGPALDSWYKISEKGNAVGFAHEILTRARPGSSFRYTYVADAETELLVPDTKDPKKQVSRTESLRIEGQLDDTYGPVTLKRTDARDESTVVCNILNDDAGRRIDMAVGSEHKMIPVSPDEEVHYSRFLLFISLRQNGKLAKPGTQRALLFAPRPDEQSPIVEVQLEVHEVLKKAYLDKKEVSVTRVTYLKPPPAATRDAELLEAFVDRFGRVVEETTRGGLRRVLVKDEAEAVGQNERPRHGGRRDPFDKKPAMNVVNEGPKKEGTEVQLIDPQDIGKTFKDIEAQLEELKKCKEEKREDDGNKIYDRLIATLIYMKSPQYPKPLTPEQLARVEALRQQIEEIWGGLARLMKNLRGVYIQVADAFNQDECASMEKGIDELKKAVQTRKELEDTDDLRQVLKWIGELEPLVAKCKTRIELGRKKLVLIGTLLHEDVQMMPLDASINVFGHQVGGIQEVRFTKPNRIAVINDKMYRMGDIVEGEGVRVEKIWAFGIQVSLREETRDVGIRQK